MRSYPAKLLLFGEHTVLVGSSSLAIPFRKYSMRWQERSAQDVHPKWLTEYADFLNRECSHFLNIGALESHLITHTIKANIPIGYGLGSSGALTAAIYDIAGDGRLPLGQLQSHFGTMESFFHGESSGFDPLISYVDQPIIRRDGQLEVVDDWQIDPAVNIYLLDSQQPRQGKTTIKAFLEYHKSHPTAIQQLIDANNIAVQQSLSGDKGIYHTVQEISRLQREHLSFMIIEPLRDLWDRGLETGDYSIKVCGAGGGGYYLVFSREEMSGLGAFEMVGV